MRFLFVGLGSISTKHIKDVVAIANEQKIECNITILRREISELPKELFSLKIRQIAELGDECYDVAFITNPTNLHYEILDKLKGKSNFFFIEKPIFESCKYDYRQLGITGKNAYIAAPMRHTGTYKELKNIIEENKVFSARIICSSYLPEWRPNIDYRKNYSAIKALGGGVTLDLIHEIDYMVGLFGLPEKVFNVHGKYSSLEIDSDDLSVYIAKYKDKLCEVHLDYFGREYQRKCELYTANGTYIADFKDNTISFPDGSIKDCNINNKTDLFMEMEYIFDFIAGKIKDNINTPEHGFEVLKISLGEI
ncbi:MAG: Gfo/Idh/MocA family oxidoreductase [Treponema sp.]|nr:Gfo/Idh/MocA family oxidoreductase [Treponema sp.]